MADAEVATKAPESDAQTLEDDPQTASLAKDQPAAKATEQDSLIPGDTPAQSGPSMGDHCTTDQPLPPESAHATPTGEMATVNTVSCYISKPADYPHNPGKLLLLLTGGTGIHSVNNQLQADDFAGRGFLVVMPDQFAGDPAPRTGTMEPSETQIEASSPTLLEKFKLGVAETAKSFLIDMWLARHTAEKVMPIIRKTLIGASEEFADAIANGGGVYCVGYCFGAKYALLLCGDEETSPAEDDGQETKSPPVVKAGAIAHGTLITSDDIERVRKPVTMMCVENDTLFPDDIREQGRASLELNAVEHEVKVFQGVPHGFAVLGDYRSEEIQQKQKEAFEMMCGWLESH